jgi:hypothetical protein
VVASAILGAITWLVLLLLFGIVVGLIKFGVRSMSFAIAFSVYELTTTLRNLALIGGLVAAATVSLGLLWRQGVKMAALIAIYVSLLIILAGFALRDWYQNHQLSLAIGYQFSQFCSAIEEGKHKAAYRHMSPEYRQANSLDQFKADKNLQDGLYYNIEAWGCELSPGHRVEVSVSSAVLYSERYPFMELYGGPAYELVKVDWAWWFTGKSIWYTD